jgi:pimeloyl-ACP methyl ester carboxylesterase
MGWLMRRSPVIAFFLVAYALTWAYWIPLLALVERLQHNMTAATAAGNGFIGVFSTVCVIVWAVGLMRRDRSDEAEKCFVNVNGATQGMFIESRTPGAPVLLYLHGGMPEYFLTPIHPTALSEHFTVVWWEQRGSGLSYDWRAVPGAITADQLIDDTLSLSRYVRDRFSQDAIYLMGHSGGTFTGIQAAARAPELYRAYIGVAQMCHQLESEQRAYHYMLSAFRERSDVQMVRRLERSPVSSDAGTPPGYLRVRDTAMHRLGIGTTRTMTSVVSGVLLPSLRFPEYTVMEKAKLWMAKARSGTSLLWNEMLTSDLRLRVPEVRLPVYFLHGIHDYTCSYGLAREYHEELTAPIKGFYSFLSSAHSPIFEEPARAMQIIRNDILRGSVSLADQDRHVSTA